MDNEYIELSPKEYWQKYPEMVTSWFTYAEHLAESGDLEQAQRIYEEAICSKVLTRKVRLAESYAKFADTYLDFNAASSVFETVLTITNSHSVATSYIKCLIKNKKYDLAERLLIEQTEIKGSNSIWLMLANLYEKQESYHKAISIYEKLVERNESNGEAWRRLRKAEKKNTHSLNNNTIIKSLSFEPKYHSAGLAILQNFGTELNKKYPDGGVAFTIEQQGLKITMIIEHPEGHQEIVEDYLNRYGLVVTGQITPEQYTADPLEMMELKRQIIHMEGELKWANEKQRMLEGTIVSQDSEIKYFQNQMKDMLSTHQSQLLAHNNFVCDLITNLNEKDININNLVNQLIDSAKAENIVRTNCISSELQDKSPSVLNKIKEFSYTTMASATGNAPAWVEFLSRSLP
ncbi:hypothetical protein OPW13_06985 [Vibrio europaeus]|uniref:Uncharacterized protein n=1 Tax=Vibrio europaeus TaxID=300876 RepID=A0A178J8K0_9VIBR|nr:tetratricopeptide repeat protein [Vibrio europaeus]MDC5704750.1 hypothetical protein [Vibrio europaeus]MDC5710029.1 hypothetical protein [Vibrio europaeus]MDC5715119.1 hypothetical protein [Vibrio europaeus]MDC5719027.1 hypothetical protein [Vibrio europaeus]MDC5844149.1 hypothetical protein [Vibrio europaeus]